jgi:hypothetical protein
MARPLHLLEPALLIPTGIMRLFSWAFVIPVTLITIIIDSHLAIGSVFHSIVVLLSLCLVLGFTVLGTKKLNEQLRTSIKSIWELQTPEEPVIYGVPTSGDADDLRRELGSDDWSSGTRDTEDFEEIKQHKPARGFSSLSFSLNLFFDSFFQKAKLAKAQVHARLEGPPSVSSPILNTAEEARLAQFQCMPVHLLCLLRQKSKLPSNVKRKKFGFVCYLRILSTKRLMIFPRILARIHASWLLSVVGSGSHRRTVLFQNLELSTGRFWSSCTKTKQKQLKKTQRSDHRQSRA